MELQDCVDRRLADSGRPIARIIPAVVATNNHNNIHDDDDDDDKDKLWSLYDSFRPVETSRSVAQVWRHSRHPDVRASLDFLITESDCN